jgi:hypothetical protein
MQVGTTAFWHVTRPDVKLRAFVIGSSPAATEEAESVRRTIAWIAVSTVIGLAGVGPAAAQSPQMPGRMPPHRAEISFFGGGSWTDSREVLVGTDPGNLDIDDSGFWGIAADFNVRPGTGQAEILYSRQDSKLRFESPLSPAENQTVDMAVEYLQFGGLGGVVRRNVYTFASFTLGATRFSFDDASIDDEWKFSALFGFGAKLYVNEKFGLRAQARFPFTFISGGGSVACGNFGCFTTVGGEGVFQFDLGGGAFVMF